MQIQTVAYWLGFEEVNTIPNNIDYQIKITNLSELTEKIEEVINDWEVESDYEFELTQEELINITIQATMVLLGCGYINKNIISTMICQLC